MSYIKVFNQVFIWAPSGDLASSSTDFQRGIRHYPLAVRVQLFRYIVCNFAYRVLHRRHVAIRYEAGPQEFSGNAIRLSFCVFE